MKASEYIKLLEGIISEHGDLDVAYQQYFEQDGTNVFDMDFSFYVDYPDSEDTVYDDKGRKVEREAVIAINHTI